MLWGIKNEIVSNASVIAEILLANNDVLLKKTKNGQIKIMFYEPKNIKNIKGEE